MGNSHPPEKGTFTPLPILLFTLARATLSPALFLNTWTYADSSFPADRVLVLTDATAGARVLYHPHGDGGCVIWLLLIGVVRAKEYLMTSDLMNAREAERIRLVNRVLPSGEVLPAALALARRLDHGPTLAISLTKAALNEYIKHHMSVTLRPSLTAEFLTMKSQDYAEGVNAFLEKRPPRSTGT